MVNIDFALSIPVPTLQIAATVVTPQVLQDSWAVQRPIYKRLPGESQAYYKDPDPDFYDPVTDPPIADWLTQWPDAELIKAKGLMDDFYFDYLNPVTCREDALDWLAQFAGFTGEYWDTSWPTEAKRALIANAYTFIWENKGSRAVMEWMIALFDLNASVYTVGVFLAGISKAGDTLGGRPLEFYLLIPGITYLRTSAEWALLEKLRVLYSPVYCKTQVCYDKFYAGFSVAGEPVF